MSGDTYQGQVIRSVTISADVEALEFASVKPVKGFAFGMNIKQSVGVVVDVDQRLVSAVRASNGFKA